MIYNIMDSWAGKEVYWGNSSYETYCLLQPGANVAQAQKLATALIDKNIPKKSLFIANLPIVIFQQLTFLFQFLKIVRLPIVIYLWQSLMGQD